MNSASPSFRLLLLLAPTPPVSPQFWAAGLLAIAIASLCGTSAAAFEIPVDLTLPSGPGNVNELELTASLSIFNASDTAVLSGNVDSIIGIEFFDAGVSTTGVRFDGGAIAATDVSLGLGLLSATTSGLAGSLATTTSGLSPVTDGEFSTAGHELTVDEGTLTAAGEVSDLSTEPFVFSTASGIATLAVTPLSPSGNLHPFAVLLTLPLDDSETVDGGILLTIQGNVVAEGIFTLNVPLGEFGGEGIVDGVDYAVWRERFADGQAPASDFTAWQESFGEVVEVAPTPGSAALSSHATPEPASLALLLGAWTATLTGGVHRRRSRT